MQYLQKEPGRVRLARKWLEFEQISGTAQTIQDCQKALRKVLPSGIEL